MDAPLKQLKGYEIRERIGAGGFGAVYKAYQSTIGREVAIKVILPGHANQPDFIRRFESEAQLVARLEHPHITPLYDYWRDPEGAYLVMRWLRGGSLRDALKNGAFELRAAALLLDQVAGALSLAHRNGVIHRDIKPGNILLDEDGNAYLTDFGIAKNLNSPSSNTGSNAILGSLDYLSPEQARSESVTPRTDIYSLGVTLYEVITGHHPFENVSSVERLYKHINDPLPEITTLEAGVSAAVNSVIQKATAKNPEHRYPDALAFAADFREAIGLNRASTTIVELLTQREQEILQLIIDGLANKEIAQRLTLTLGTVKWHVNQIYGKLGVRSRVQAIVRSRELHLIVKPGEDPATVVIRTDDYPANPYKGLLAFQSADNQDFFGREKITEKLIKRMGETDEYSRFLAIVGPSGSGKSSLVKAGLIPAIWRGALTGSEKWFVVEMLPGAHPLDELEVALTRVAANQTGSLNEQLQRDNRGLVRVAGLILPNDGTELVIVIDQFEEVFTLLEDEAARQHFLDLIYTAVTEPRSRVRVIMTLRADFYDRPLYYPQFGQLVRNRLETIMPLSSAELESAIVRPAERIDVTFEPGLVASIIGDVNYQPGALPLLQYALTELFEQRQGHVLTREAYQAIGGTVGALAKRAEEVYLSLDEGGRAITRQVFLRLVTLGEGAEDTRRRTAQSELRAISTDNDTLDEILDVFSQSRLFSLDTDPATRTPTVELAHEALLREWERLRAWLNESRDDIKLHRQIAGMAEEWRTNEREASFLARGSRLAQFEAWMHDTTLSLTSRERDFLDASLMQRRRETDVESERQQREKRLEQRSRTFLRGLVGVLLVAVIVAAGLTTLAVNNASEAQTERDNTRNALATSDANFSRAEQQRLYLSANEAMDINASGNVGMALAIRSLAYGYSAGADAALIRASSQGMIRQIYTGQQFELYGVMYSPDGTLVATSTEGGTRIYDAVTGEELRLLPYDEIVRSIVFSPDGETVLTTGNLDVFLWDTASGTLIRTYTNESEPYYATFSPDGSKIIVWMIDAHQLWDTESGERLESYPTAIDDTHELIDLFYAQDGGLRFAIKGEENRVYLEDAQTGEETCTVLEAGSAPWSIFSWGNGHPIGVIATQDDNIAYAWNLETCTLLSQFDGHKSPVYNADYDSNRNVIVTGDNSGVAIQWDAQTGRELGRYLINNQIRALDISPDGNSLLMPQWNNAFAWDLTFPQEPRALVSDQFDHTHFPRFSPNGENVYVGGFGVYSRWSLTEESFDPIITYEQPIRGLDISPDGQTVVASMESEDDKSLYLIDADTGEFLREFPGFTDDANFSDISPDGTKIISGSFDLTARIWDIATGETLHVLTGHTGVIASSMFSPDGTSVLTTSSDGTIRLWDVATGEIIRIFDLGEPFPYADFSPDGTRIATGSTEGTGYILDIATGEILHTLVGHTDIIWTTRYSPDGRFIVTASWDGTAHIWNAETGETVRVLNNRTTHALYYAEFSPDNKFVITGSEQDDRVYLWRVDLDETIASFCARQPLELSAEQRVQYGTPDDASVCPPGG